MKINHPSISMNRAISCYYQYLTLVTHVSKRQWDPWYTGKVYIIPSGHKTDLANLTKNKRQPKVWSCTSTKLVITTPYSTLGVDLISQYTLKGKDYISIIFMCLAIVDPTTTWFNIIQLPTMVTRLTVHNMDNGRKATFILTWENIFPAKVFFVIWVKNTREIK